MLNLISPYLLIDVLGVHFLSNVCNIFILLELLFYGGLLQIFSDHIRVGLGELFSSLLLLVLLSEEVVQICHVGG